MLPPACASGMKEGWSGTSRGAPTFSLVEMVRGRSTPVFFGGHFHVTRFGMFRSRAGLALNPWSTAASPQLAYRHRPFSTLKSDIRTAPPSRSRVNRVLAKQGSAVKEKNHNHVHDKTHHRE